ncbi:acyltransferase family protein [Planctomicrobium sp. SH664]|uniref:acyltransferase family protein n=1 Tax=Planctomicrobium sp. SH664 TaxID=3448125 RepID=UPI003F5B9205
MSYKIREEPPTPRPAKPRPPENSAPSSPAAPVVSTKTAVRQPVERLRSLDAFRGFIMLVLAAHGFGLGQLARSPQDSLVWKIVDRGAIRKIGSHFEHPPYQSSFVPGSNDPREGSPWKHWAVSFWDLIQPAFMFMVGAAMPFSYRRRSEGGESRWRQTLHAAIRSVVLILLGVFLYSLGSSSTQWIFPNVLAQIGLGYFFVTLLLNRPQWVQWGALVVILAGTWAFLHYSPQGNYVPADVGASYKRGEIYEPPYAQWSKNGNAFHAFDVWLLNRFPRPQDEKPFRFNRGGYQTLNFVPSMATMLLGLLCGQLLMSSVEPSRKFCYLLLGALVCWGLGVVAGATCCPIVKRIWTPAWVLFSGGYVIGMLALFYLFFDLFRLKWLAFPLVVVGMNSLLVYVLGETLASWIVANVNRHFHWAIDGLLSLCNRMFHWLDGLQIPPEQAGHTLHQAFEPVVNGVSVALVLWLLCYWLFRQKIFVRI